MNETVLIIDDDEQTLRLVGLMLERQGFKVVTAINGFNGIHSARSEKPDAILLDVMMPDMDGYEVTRLLRSNPETSSIPILMFTARSEMEDKITGYEAGVDDYVTKPIHPAELVAHLRAVLSRRATAAATAAASAVPDKNRAYTIGVLGPKGGLGVSTLVLNLGITFYQRARRDVIAAEVRPGQGTWTTELALSNADGLSTLLNKRPNEITPPLVEKELVRLPYGIRLLTAGSSSKNHELINRTDQLLAVIQSLSQLSRMVLLDIGTPFVPQLDRLLETCDEMIIVTEPFPSTAHRTRTLVEDILSFNLSKNKIMTLVSLNRIRADVQISLLQLQEIIKLPIAQMIPPVPEAAYQAATRSVPICQVPVSSFFTQQIQNLAQMITERVPA